MKRFAYTIALLIGITSVAFASDPTDQKSPTAEPAAVLSAEELALEAQLAEEFEISVSDVIAGLSAEPSISAVKVFDFAGNQIASQEGEIDFSKIPAGAELLMTEGTTQYYIIAQ